MIFSLSLSTRNNNKNYTKHVIVTIGKRTEQMLILMLMPPEEYHHQRHSWKVGGGVHSFTQLTSHPSQVKSVCVDPVIFLKDHDHHHHNDDSLEHIIYFFWLKSLPMHPLPFIVYAVDLQNILMFFSKKGLREKKVKWKICKMNVVSCSALFTLFFSG